MKLDKGCCPKCKGTGRAPIPKDLLATLEKCPAEGVFLTSDVRVKGMAKTTTNYRLGRLTVFGRIECVGKRGRDSRWRRLS